MFGILEELRARPIPDLDSVRVAKKGYRQWPIDTGSEAFTEPCLDLRTEGFVGANLYHRSDLPPYYAPAPGAIEECYARIGVLGRLRIAAEQLEACGLELFIHDGWRPVSVQRYFHDEWFPGELRKKYPDWPAERISAEVDSYWAVSPATEDSLDSLSPPPHSTGAALDLTLRVKGGDFLWMGTIVDDVTPRAHTDAFETVSRDLSFTDDEARQNRRLLYWVMTEAGFVNNPTEWWHYSYGDQMWAKLESARTGTEVRACYSNIDPRV